MFKIVSKEMLTPLVCKMQLSAPRLAKAVLPGQFLIVRTKENGERIPLTVSDYDAEAGLVTIVTQKVGASTIDLVENFGEGNSFLDVAGPLGNASDFTADGAEDLKKEHFVFIAGGVGAAPVYPQVRWLHARGVAVDVILGAKSKDLLIYREELESACDHLFICTDDGSEGFHGLVTNCLENLVAEGNSYTKVVAIGPMIMMKFATLTARKLGLPVIVSLNTLMVDGTGMCGACRVSVAGKMKFTCVDGPEFNGYDVDFDEVMRRQGQYKEEEQLWLKK